MKLSEAISDYFKNLIEKNVYEVDVVNCNADIQEILRKYENEREEHNREDD